MFLNICVMDLLKIKSNEFDRIKSIIFCHVGLKDVDMVQNQ
jgi:hypothetical protein